MNEQNWYTCKRPAKLLKQVEANKKRMRLLLASWLRETMRVLYKDMGFYHSDDSTHLWSMVATLEAGSVYHPPSVRSVSTSGVWELILMCRTLTDADGDSSLPVLRVSDILNRNNWLSDQNQADIFRTIFAPPWLDLDIPVNNDVLSLAAAIYETQEHLSPELTNILADALEDVGCTNEHVIQSLRGKTLRYPGRKWEEAATRLYRGCFVIETILNSSSEEK